MSVDREHHGKGAMAASSQSTTHARNHDSIQTFYRQVDSLDAATKRAVFATITPRIEAIKSAEHAAIANKPLSGLTCVLKDNFDLAGYPTNASSVFLETVRPGPHADGPLVQTIKAKGLAILGKTQMNEFAYGLDGANPHCGNCPHPGDSQLVSGGSSSGSAWAVAKGFADIGFGTDTGGSIRVPSAFCGLYGLRLPPNEWARKGCITLAPSFDTVGWMTKKLSTLAQASLALLDLVPSNESKPLSVIAIGPMSDTTLKGIGDQFNGCIDARHERHQLFAPQVSKAFSVLQSIEAYALHRPWIRNHRKQYDPAVLRRILRAEAWTSEEISEAHAVRQSICQDLEEMFQHCDIALLPVTESPTPKQTMTEVQREELLRQTAPASLAGLPVLTIPLPSSASTTIGIQCLMPTSRWRQILPSLFQLLTTTTQDD
ncbi:amidase family protein [Cerasicoccus fimbriatus]|uniref:amidase family protein n=1 Tax=Cerasicoccus fimbriatus TaxID=3014554 RepID=UPI0022B585CB|nr:amidase family protein [Cerasicoccus sp. TK19100]